MLLILVEKKIIVALKNHEDGGRIGVEGVRIEIEAAPFSGYNRLTWAAVPVRKILAQPGQRKHSI